MTWYQDIALAEPTIVGTVGAGVCHLLLWLCVTSWEFGLAKHIDLWLSRHFAKRYSDVIRKNFEAKDDLEIWGMADVPERIWVAYICTFLHHGTAGLLMYTGMVTETTWIWRHGLLTQLFGSDLLDFARIAWCLLLPPGPWPTCNGIKTRKYMTVIGLHHSTSLLAGLPVSIYFADQPEFQFMGILLAGYPMCLIFFDLVSKVMHPDYQIVHAAGDVIMSSGFSYQRIVMYFPIAASLLQTVYESETVPILAKVSLAVGGLMMSLFNLMMLAMSSKNMMKLVSKFRGDTKVKDEKDSSIASTTTAEGSARKCTDEQAEDFPTLLRKRKPDCQSAGGAKSAAGC